MVRDAAGHDLSEMLPELAGLAVRVAARSAILDGELVVVDAAGRADPPSWRAGWPASPAGPVAFLAFDLLHLDGRSLLSQPLVRRREALRRVLRPGDEVVAVPAIATEGIALFEAAVAQGIAGHPGPTAHGPLPARGAQPAVAVRGGRPAECRGATVEVGGRGRRRRRPRRSSR